MTDTLEDIYKNMVPANIRILAGTILGNREPITAKDFNAAELQTLRDIYKEKSQYNQDRLSTLRNLQYVTPQEYRKAPEYTLRWNTEGTKATSGEVPYTEYQDSLQKKIDSFEKTKGKTSISYGDYNRKDGSMAAPVSDGWLKTLYSSFTDPRYALSGTLGSYNYMDNGSRVEDNYRFNKDQQWFYNQAAEKSLPSILSDYWDRPGSLGEILFRKYIGDASRPVNIDLK